MMMMMIVHVRPILSVYIYLGVLVVQWFGVGLVIERSLVRLPAGELSSQLGQLSLPSLRGR